jgi:hypothetical protein
MATHDAMSRAQRRYLRTLLLGVAAMGTLIWAAVDQFGISWAEMRQLFLAIVIGVMLIIVVAALCVIVWQLVRRLSRRE